MENLQPTQSALEECLRSLSHLFVHITRLTYEEQYKTIMYGYSELHVAMLDSGLPAAKLVAVKKLQLRIGEFNPQRLAFRLARELKVWAGLKHPHVLPLLGFYLCNQRETAYLISEYMSHGDLKNYIVTMKPAFDERSRLVRDLTDGLAYLHTQDPRIRHGDLKPGNVLVNQNRRALLADFGLSKALNTGPSGFTTGNDAKYTARYASPELVLEGTAAESLSNDVWSWACLTVEALMDRVPFANVQLESQLIVALLRGQLPSETNHALFPPPLKILLGKCWSHQPMGRPTAVDCLQVIESSLIGSRADRSDEFAFRLSRGNRGFIGASVGGPVRVTGKPTKHEDTDRTRTILAPSLPTNPNPVDPSIPGGVGRSSMASKLTAPATAATTVPPPTSLSRIFYGIPVASSPGLSTGSPLAGRANPVPSTALSRSSYDKPVTSSPGSIPRIPGSPTENSIPLTPPSLSSYDIPVISIPGPTHRITGRPRSNAISLEYHPRLGPWS